MSTDLEVNYNETDRELAKRFLHIAVPGGLGFFFHTMFNVVDTLYAGMISTEALAALAICFPLYFSIISVGSGFGRGLASLVGNAIGARDYDAAGSYAAQGVIVGILLSLLICLVGGWAAPRVLLMLGATKGAYLDGALGYIQPIFMGSSFFALVGVLVNLLIAQGDSRQMRNFLGIGFILNVLFNPWFIYGGFGVPAMGVAGIAWATVLIEGLGVVFLARHVLLTPVGKALKRAHFRPTLSVWRDIFVQGVPLCFLLLTVSAGSFIIVYFISDYGKDVVAGYSIGIRIEQLVLLPVIGLNMAVLSLVSHANGAGDLERVKAVVALGMRYGTWITISGVALVLVFAKQAVALFAQSPLVISHGKGYLVFAVFVMGAYLTIFIYLAALQGLKRSGYAFGVGALRQIVLPMVVFPVLGSTLALRERGVWLGLILVNWIGAFFAVYLFGRAMSTRACELSGRGQESSPEKS